MLLQLPPIGNPESNLIPGMAAPLPPEPELAPASAPVLQTYTGGNPNIPDSSVPGPLAQLQEIVGWVYDFDPGTGVARASFSGEVTFTSGGSAGAVTSFNTRTGAVVLTAADVTGVGALVNPSVSLTGVPLTPTATPGTSTTQIASTQFVGAAIAAASFLPLAGGALTGPVTSSSTLQCTGMLTGGNLTVGSTAIIGAGGQWGFGAATLVAENAAGAVPAANFAAVGPGTTVNVRTDNAGNFLSFFYQTTGVGTISTNGSATAYNTSSDRNLKENIADIDGNMVSEVIDYLTPVSFTWKAQPDLGRQYGFIAQDVGDIFPNAVTPSVGTYGEADYVPWQIDTLSLIPLLLAEIQSLRQRVSVLESGGVS